MCKKKKKKKQRKEHSDKQDVGQKKTERRCGCVFRTEYLLCNSIHRENTFPFAVLSSNKGEKEKEKKRKTRQEQILAMMTTETTTKGDFSGENGTKSNQTLFSALF